MKLTGAGQSRSARITLCSLFAAMSLSVSALASDLGEAARRMLEMGSLDAPAIAYDLKDSFLSDGQWRAEVEQFRRRFEDWEKDTSGGMDQYLNDRLIIVGLGAVGGKLEKVKKGIIWLALYKEFEQEAPSCIVRFVRDNRESLIRLFTDCSWDKVSFYIKNKQWKRDAEDRKRLTLARGR